MNKPTLLLVALMLSVASVAQTDPDYYATNDKEMQEKYWKYRDQLKKYFMKVGPERGESIPCRNRAIGWMQDFNNPAGSRMRWTDATIDVGYYLVLLATEYRLLDEHGQSTSSTENELYYALNALNRLDLYAENYLSEGNLNVQASHKNGLLMRDDVDFDFWENFQDEGFAYVRTDYSHVNLVSDYDTAAVLPGYSHELLPDYDYNDNSNEASKDQISTPLMSTPLS